MQHLCVFLLAAGLLAISSPADAAEPAPQAVQIEAVELGFGGTYKVGHWAPIWITVAGLQEPGVQVELTTADGDGVLVSYLDERPPVAQPLEPGRQRLLSYVKFGRTRSALDVRLVSGGQTLSQRRFAAHELSSPLLSTQELILVLGPSIGEEEAVRRKLRDQAGQTVIQRLNEADLLPRRWYGYEGVNLVVAATGQTSLLERMDDEQFAAFSRWLQLGGRLVFSIGQRGGEILAEGSRLAAFAPGQFSEVAAQRTISGLQDYAGAAERLDAAGGQRIRRFSLPLTVLTGVRGVIESSEIGGPEGQLPTIVRHSFGMGQIVFLAFDPELPPFDLWQGRPGLISRVLQASFGWRGQAEDDGQRGRIAHLGYDDLTGQLRAALDQFQDVTRAEFSWVVGLLVVYLLLIGPADYFLLKKVRRMHWTWLTFPLIVLAFCGLAVLLAGRFSGHRLHVNQVDLVDVDVGTGVARGTTWAHLYSPRTDTFDLSLEARWPVPASAGSGMLFGWQGLPGEGLGGLNTTARSTLFPLHYQVRQPQEAAPELIGLPIQVSSSRSFLAQWWADVEPPTRGNLSVDRNGLLGGSLTNPLDIELSDCMVLYRNWSYPITGALRPGQELFFDGLPPRNLEWRLTRRRVVDSKDISTPWDQTSLDLPRILEVMMFHRAAGGRSYTTLGHRYQPYLDLSDHLRTGQAILVGRGAAPASRLTRGGQSLADVTDRQLTIYRVLFPVESPP